MLLTKPYFLAAATKSSGSVPSGVHLLSRRSSASVLATPFESSTISRQAGAQEYPVSCLCRRGLLGIKDFFSKGKALAAQLIDGRVTNDLSGLLINHYFANRSSLTACIY